jgi:hypothetical protein
MLATKHLSRAVGAKFLVDDISVQVETGEILAALLRAIATLSAQAKVEKRRAQIRIVSTAQLTDPVGIERADRARSAQADVDLFAPENPRDAELGCLRRLADYALKGGFVIT